MDAVLTQVGVAVAGAVGGLMIGNAGVLADARKPVSLIQHAMRYVEGQKAHKMLSLTQVRRHSLRMKHCVDQIFDNVCQLAALNHKVSAIDPDTNQPYMPVSLRWGNIAHEFFVKVQANALEIDQTLYLERFDNFFKIRATLQEMVAYSHDCVWSTRDGATAAYKNALNSTGPNPKQVNVVSVA